MHMQLHADDGCGRDAGSSPFACESGVLVRANAALSELVRSGYVLQHITGAMCCVRLCAAGDRNHAITSRHDEAQHINDRLSAPLVLALVWDTDAA
jgi:hypothetical protein